MRIFASALCLAFVGPAALPVAAAAGTIPAVTSLSAAAVSAAPAANSMALQAVAAVAAAPAAGSYQPLNSYRLLDTRTRRGASGPVSAFQPVAVQISGVGGIPRSGVSAVALTVTVTRPTSAGYVTVYPDGAARPAASNVNFLPGQTLANLVVVPLGSNGKIRLFNNSAGSVHYVGEVAGYYTSGTPTAAGTFRALTAVRLLDTRAKIAARGAVAGNHSIAIRMAGRGGIPRSGVSAVAINLTVTGAKKSGYLTVYPDGVRLPALPRINYVAGRTAANLLVVPVGADGYIRIYSGSAGPVDVIGDVAGYYLAGTPRVAGAFRPVQAARLLDTRTVQGAGVAGQRSVAVQVTGRGGVPSSSVTAVALEVTVVAPAASGFVGVYPDYSARPGTSNLVYPAGRTISALVLAPIGANGSVRLYNGGGRVDVVVDVLGFYSAGAGLGRCNSVLPDARGTAITRWHPLVGCVLGMLRQSTGNIADVDTMIRYESSGDARAINLYDINAQRGHPSIGLIQVIRPTFDTYRAVTLANDLYDPAANLFAGLNYAIRTYGSIHNIPGLVSLRRGGGYKGYVVHR